MTRLMESTEKYLRSWIEAAVAGESVDPIDPDDLEDCLEEIATLRAETKKLRAELSDVLAERDGFCSIATQLERENSRLTDALSGRGR